MSNKMIGLGHLVNPERGGYNLTATEKYKSDDRVRPATFEMKEVRFNLSHDEDGINTLTAFTRAKNVVYAGNIPAYIQFANFVNVRPGYCSGDAEFLTLGFYGTLVALHRYHDKSFPVFATPDGEPEFVYHGDRKYFHSYELADPDPRVPLAFYDITITPMQQQGERGW